MNHVGKQATEGHDVVSDGDTDRLAYQSLRKRPADRSERYALGKALRKKVPRSSLGEWRIGREDRDPIALVEENHEGRIPELVAVRVARMAASPYGFLRGSAVVMADDVARLPATGITPVVCGDAHLGNVGFYASPERDLVLDLNDFDEAHPGSWEWDLRRLVASTWVAGRETGASEKKCKQAVLTCARSYREEIRYQANQALFTRSFERLDMDRMALHETGSSLDSELKRAAKRARKRTSDRALPRFTTENGGARQIVEEPPLITRLPEAEAEMVAEGLDEYLMTLDPHWRRLLGGYTLVDVAHKVVGVGSVGLRAYVALLEGSSKEDVIFLQLKQARRSVLARHVHGDKALHEHQGQRVVEYQKALQTVSDPLLGWTTVDDRQFYVRQFRNMKGAVSLKNISGKALANYAGIAGRLLAKGHARTSGASMIAGYVGKGTNLDKAMATFARAYADQTEADHEALLAAVESGRMPIAEGA
ncbi:DUF2252 domain-containing protein [Demequina muriae]|uniref:DUF2252 domain-containing protein n=1 Tax=Demequina muriae TaxID=3051664 RepID=A0ABT8GEN5_9MICO|nr:DUF2252 domain-containing protein [Demequina sp. EGI L300058]MDN4479721.1 DUF2252 domain-containing protein [Demequina sp. EGI L300058]